MVFKTENCIFTEKYRPKLIKDIVGDFKNKIAKYLENPQAIPNFLLYSKSPGTGKTTLMKAIVNELGCDYLMINSSDDRTLEVVRDKVKQFIMSQSSKADLKRCVAMDEVDGMGRIQQEALRNMIETYAKNSFFIFTANNVNKVIEPIRSRCVEISFAYPNKEEVFHYLKDICVKEKIFFDEDGLISLIEKNYPSIRNCVLALQDMKTEDKKVIRENIKANNDLFESLWLALKEKDWKKVKEEVMATTVDPRELNSFFWQKSLDEENLKLIQITCRNERDISFGADPKVIMVTSLIEMVK